jgi:5-methyltetrahydropteroyltriglutamate--homocysteine methyltransferase
LEGVVIKPTDLVDHPEVVADRIITFAEIVGQENVIAGSDCGLGGRVHSQVAWAKLRALRDGGAKEKDYRSWTSRQNFSRANRVSPKWKRATRRFP